MSKSYEDGILDCLAILNKWTDIGIYDVPIAYIREPMEKLLNTTAEGVGEYKDPYNV